uniref:(northern house mosquito) hypothetical protein n=1 Tax=Culex pipiens TaxID=7175 RepID=A0A8D8C4C8_CULPI
MMLPSRQPRTVLSPFIQTGFWPLHCHWMKPPKKKVARLSIPTSQKHNPNLCLSFAFRQRCDSDVRRLASGFLFRFGRGKSYRRDRRRVSLFEKCAGFLACDFGYKV